MLCRSLDPTLGLMSTFVKRPFTSFFLFVSFPFVPLWLFHSFWFEFVRVQFWVRFSSSIFEFDFWVRFSSSIFEFDFFYADSSMIIWNSRWHLKKEWKKSWSWNILTYVIYMLKFSIIPKIQSTNAIEMHQELFIFCNDLTITTLLSYGNYNVSSNKIL